MTKKEMFTAIRARVEDDAEMTAFIDHEIELLNSRAGALKKPTAQQIENEALMTAIVDTLEMSDRPLTISELVEAGGDSLAHIKGNQHANSLLIKLRRAGKVKSEKVKNVTYFSIGLDSKYFPGGVIIQ